MAIAIPKVKLNITRIAEIFGIAAAIVAIIQLWVQVNELKNDKREIYDYLTSEIKNKENAIQNLREENFRLETAIQHIQQVPAKEFRFFQPTYGSFYGKVISSGNSPIVDVQIEAIGGAQVFSNINGEFSLTCRIGQLIQFKKSGYRPHELVIGTEHLNSYQRITLTRGD